MNAIEIMNEEHRYIKRMLKVVRKACLDILKGGDINYDDFSLIINFIREYSDEHHHKKEEKILFNEMVKYLGEIADNIINHGMLVEHDLGRSYVRALSESIEKLKNGDEEAKLDIIANAISYTHLLEGHIDKEDNAVYTLAQRQLDKDILEKIDEKCLDLENNSTDVKERNISILEKLEKKYL